MKNANYRKINDRSHNSSTYHKKDGTPIRHRLKEMAQREIERAVENECDNLTTYRENADTDLISKVTIETVHGEKHTVYVNSHVTSRVDLELQLEDYPVIERAETE